MHWKSKKLWLGIGAGALLSFLVLGLMVRAWLVPTLIIRAVQSQYAGRVTIRDYWLGGSSAGVVGLALHEGEGAETPVWASAERVGTDLSIGGLLGGHFVPGKVEIESPRIAYRVGKDGLPLTKVPLKPHEASPGGKPSPLPAIDVRDAQVTFAQEGRPDLVITGIDGGLTPGEGGAATLEGKADDATWGDWTAHGQIAAGMKSISVQLDGKNVEADPKKVRSVPFVPPDVWEHVQPTGPVDIALRLDVNPATEPPIRVFTEANCRGTTVALPTFGITATESTGGLTVDGGLVHLEQFAGKSLGGTVNVDGSLDFGPAIPRIDLDFAATKLDMAKVPPQWQLGDLEATGLLDGKAQIKIALDPQGADLTGTTGEVVIEGGSIQGIPIKSLRFDLHAEGRDLIYESEEAKADAGAPGVPSNPAAEGGDPPGHAPPPSSPAKTVGGAHPPGSPDPSFRGGPTTRNGPSGWSIPGFRDDTPATRALLLVALQAPPAPAPASAPEPKKPTIRLPKTITTEIELEDVEVAQLLARLRALGIEVPVPIAGRVSIKAKATIPLGSLRDASQYEVHGEATLADATIDGVDLGLLSGKLDLADGVAELKELRGQLVNLPDGGYQKRPGKAEPPPLEGPLPPGAFRGQLRAEIAPQGAINAAFEGEQLPLGELAAPALPKPTPLSGLLTLQVNVRGRVEALADPKAWIAKGEARSVQIKYQGATLDELRTAFALEDGTLHVPEFEARLAGKPFTAQAELGLAEPHAFSGSVEVNDWDLAQILAFVPGAPKPAPISGSLLARAEAKGTLKPVDLQTKGSGRLDRFRAGPIPLGQVPFRWATEGDAVLVSIVEAHPFGGQLSAEARVPFRGDDRAIRGSLAIERVDTARLAASLPGGGLQMTGTAGGQASFVLDPAAASEPIRAEVDLRAPDLTIQGIPAEAVQADLRVREGTLSYELMADSLGGKVRLQGGVPLGALGLPTGTATPSESQAETGPAAPPVAEGELQVAGFQLGALWRAIRMTGPLAQLGGLGAVRANLRVGFDPLAPAARGLAELRNLHWGRNIPLGHLRTEIAYLPTAWRVGPLTGDLFGGTIQGHLQGDTPAGGGPVRMTFDAFLDRFALDKLLAIVPGLAGKTSGTGTLRVGGRSDHGLHADVIFRTSRARVAGLPIDELRVPAQVTMAPGSGAGTVRVRGWSARISSGQVRGDAEIRLGSSRAFKAKANLTGVDVEPIARAAGGGGPRNLSGRISGLVEVQGPDPARLDRLRGKLDLDLYDATLFEIPVFRELGRFVGSAGRGVFERGDLRATIANGQINVEELSLDGQAIQLHAFGTVGFNQELDLAVLVNTADLVPQSGQALLVLIPGLGEAIGAGGRAISQVASFLSDRLLKFHVTGTLSNPHVAIDPAIAVTETAAGFFAATLRLPIPGLRR